MGDRTWVHLVIREKDIPRANEILGIEHCQVGEDTISSWVPVQLPDIAGLVFTEFAECNYGNLPEEGKLQQAGIPYNKDWGQGDEYGPGTQYSRYTEDGQHALLEVYDSDINPNIDDLIQRIDYPEMLRQYILNHKAKNTPLPWENQDEYSKRYRTRQLLIAISPKDPA